MLWARFEILIHNFNLPWLDVFDISVSLFVAERQSVLSSLLLYFLGRFVLKTFKRKKGGGHMAEGYARATGKPGVVLVTSGPGATNVITPMQDALMDGTPLVVFTGQVPTFLIGTDSFQEADVTGLTRSCTKWNTLVTDIRDLPRRINEAFYVAQSGRPGPVLVDLPKDITAGQFACVVDGTWKRGGFRFGERKGMDSLHVHFDHWSIRRSILRVTH